MTTEWVYQARVTPAEGLAELRACAGTQFDPAVVDAFCSIPAVQREPAERHAA
jgi:HD-GYP domain-containing protein (c-di-GMP phosphodiesterase class II)